MGGESQESRDSASPLLGLRIPHPLATCPVTSSDLTRAPVGTLARVPVLEPDTLVGEYESSSRDLYCPSSLVSLEHGHPGNAPVILLTVS
jgi:hypothetical protein